MTPRKKYGMLLLFLAICLGVGAIGSYCTMEGVSTWYPTIHKPSWTPPDAVFGPVWTILYILMALALWQVWKNPSHNSKKSAYVLFGLQLFFNMIWSEIFFGMHNISLALLDLLLIWSLLLVTIRAFYKVKPLAGYLLLP